MNEKCLAIIPARGGSKRIPQKNIKSFCGKPIISYSIVSALNSGLFCEVMVSTDDDEIVKISEQYGAIVPFLRSAETSNDFAGIADVLIEVLNEYQKRNYSFDYLCCILPTAPFIGPGKIIDAFNLLKMNSYDSVLTVVKFSYPILRALKVEGGKVSMMWPENYSKRSQDLPASYHDAGQFYWIKVETFKRSKVFFTHNSGAIVLPEMEVQDIDTLEDWEISEIKYSYLLKKEL